MFDLFHGLPVHILVNHAVVVLVPLMALVTVAFTVRARWRPGLPWAILGNVVATGAALVAKKSGQILQARLSARAGSVIAKDHGDRGAVLWYFALALLIASIAAYLVVRQESRVLTSLAIALVVICGAGATYWTMITGESGSRAVWQDNIAGTKAPPG
jgi:hypothetical protein